MLEHGDTIHERATDASSFRRHKVYGVSTDGSRTPLDCAVIVMESRDEPGLIVSLSVWTAVEGGGICSLPQGQRPLAPPDPEGGEPVSTTSGCDSGAVLRSGGANLLDLFPERRGRVVR